MTSTETAAPRSARDAVALAELELRELDAAIAQMRGQLADLDAKNLLGETTTLEPNDLTRKIGSLCAERDRHTNALAVLRRRAAIEQETALVEAQRAAHAERDLRLTAVGTARRRVNDLAKAWEEAVRDYNAAENQLAQADQRLLSSSVALDKFRKEHADELSSKKESN